MTDFKKIIDGLEKEKKLLEEKLKELNIKQAQLLRIKQLKDYISQLNSDIALKAKEVNSEIVK